MRESHSLQQLAGIYTYPGWVRVKRVSSLARRAARCFRLAVTGRQYRGHIGPNLFNLLETFLAAHARHRHIQYDSRNPSSVALDNFERFVTALRDQDFIPDSLESTPRHRKHQLLIIDNQYCSAPVNVKRRSRLWRLDSRRA